MTKENFVKLIHYCANKTNRQIRIVGTYGAGPDHPMLSHFPEGNYLHAILLCVQ
jgi:23S rRNA G2069 N7-methylase RlmK/C1962 C5-methylase RlmI